MPSVGQLLSQHPTRAKDRQMAHYTVSPTTTDSPLHTNTLQDVSGTLSIIVETIMVVVNVFPIIVAIQRKRQNEGLVTDDLIIALSTTDILSVIIPTPFGLVSYFYKSWYGGKATCEFYQLTMMWFQVVSIHLISYMCIDRLLSLRMVLFYKFSVLNAAHRVKYFVLVIYILSLLIVSLPLMGLAPPAMSTSGLLCESWITSSPKNSAQSVFYISLLVLGYGNLVIILIVNSRITGLMWTLERKLQTLSGRRQTSVIQLRTDRKTIVEFTWMVITVSVLFYLTWFPTMLMLTLQKVGYKVSDISILYALLSTSLTGLLNPLIYGLFSKSYRRGYRHMLTAIFQFCCRCKKKEFQPIPAITCERGTIEEEFIDRQIHKNSGLKRSRSLHDRPFGFGFYNYGFHSSLYSALTDYQHTRGLSKSRVSINMNIKGCKRRARSLSPPPCCDVTETHPDVRVELVNRPSQSSNSERILTNSSNSSHISESNMVCDEEDSQPDDMFVQETRI